jgi:hypothetical protein
MTAFTGVFMIRISPSTLGLLSVLAVLASTSLGNAQAVDPCALLTAAEMQQAFPGTKPGNAARPDRTLQQAGISRCEWIHTSGRVVLITGGDSAEDSPEDEAKTMMSAFVDPTRPDAERRVRIETLPGVGDKTVAVLERQDTPKGITGSGVVLVVRRGKRQVVLMAMPPGNLVQRDRADALKVLADLGRAIAKRMG